jgi:hypothetical protein
VSACRGRDASHVLLNSRSAASTIHVPLIIGEGSLLRTARSVVATGNYFNETARCSCRVVSAWKIVCPKEKRGAQRLRDYSRHHVATTAALSELFGVAKHFCTKNAGKELSYKYKDIQSEYVGNLDKLKLFQKRLEAFDILEPFLIPVWINSNAICVNDHWGDRKSQCIDLTKHWSQVTLKRTCAWLRDTFDWCTNDNNLTSMEWVKKFLTNCCDINLVKHIDKKFDFLLKYEQGGITFLKVPLDEMFTMKNILIMLLQKYLNQFAQEGIAKSSLTWCVPV